MRALVIALILLCPAWAMATPRSIHVEWGYTPPSEPAVTGFRLYQEGVAVHDWLGADVRAGDATVDLTATITNFTLTATFSDNAESPRIQRPLPLTRALQQNHQIRLAQTWQSAGANGQAERSTVAMM